jgi:RND family efflux transporter MFP subunit
MDLTTESELRIEIERLNRKLEAQELHPRQIHTHETKPPARASKLTLCILGLLVLVIVVAAFFAGYIPQSKRQAMLVAEANTGEEAAPTVNVMKVTRSSSKSELILPGNIQAIAESPILARASGYIKRRYVDIGDRVTEGQLVADIDAPDLDQQVKQAKASMEQAASNIQQMIANLAQGQSNEQLAKVTAQRWANLVTKGVVSRQDNDTYQAQYEAQKANVQSLTQAIAVSKNNLGAAEANLNRLTELQGYLKVRAPFAGVITLRNVDAGTLVTEGTTLLFRVAQTNRVRTYINVPQSDAGSVHVGQSAKFSIADLSRTFTGTVTRTSNSLDPSTRTLLTEVQVDNIAGALISGMYALVDLTTPRKDPPLLIPGGTLVVRSDGPQVAVVNADRKVHYQKIQLGRDYGETIEVISGLEDGQQVIVNPGDNVQEGRAVSAVLVH